MTKPMRGAQGRINAGAEPHLEPRTRAKVSVGSVGSEMPVSPTKVQEGGSKAEAGGSRNSLHEATRHLYDEHPIAHDDLGPHHDRSDHVRHSSHVSPNKGHSYDR